MTKEKQKELNGMPERSALGKKAIEMLNAKGEMETVQKEIDKLKGELVIEFQKANLKKIKVSGYTFSYNHLEKDQIRIKAE